MYTTAMRAMPVKTRSVKLPFKRRSASSYLPSPILIVDRAELPLAISTLMAVLSIISGKQSPRPARASVPTFGIRLIYILSTTLYKALTICAAVAGKDSLIRSFVTEVVCSCSSSDAVFIIKSTFV
ncbi:hypothetical protein IMSAG049_01323 [Clostridiales bacterium]|nr:hypothetical protein IMSAG049_01323 [Clostridiales bacterium]